MREIHLPVPSSRGSFAHFPITDMSARQYFSMRVAPDQSLLVLDSDTNGDWPLVRLKKWWTDTPVSEVLSVPGWSSVDAKHLGSVHLDLEITPDGRYAIAFAGADWMAKTAFLLHAPRGYVARKPDTIITVIDLKQWKIVNSIHTTDIAEGYLHGLHLVNDKWIVLDFSLGESPPRSGLYRYDSKLISVPNLRSGPECKSNRPFRGDPMLSLGGSDAVLAKRHNDTACEDVLHAVGTVSVEALEILIYRGQDVLPAAVRERSRDLQDTEDEFFRGWGDYPYYLLYYENPPFESSSQQWYGLYGSHESDFYDLAIFDAEGQEQKAQTIHHLLCGDSSLEQRGSACACRVVDASEPQHDLLTYCRTQRGDYAGMVRREWLSVIDLDDLSGAGFIGFTRKGRETLEQIALGDSRPYVVTLEFGELLRIYAIPDQS